MFTEPNMIKLQRSGKQFIEHYATGMQTRITHVPRRLPIRILQVMLRYVLNDDLENTNFWTMIASYKFC
jgi:hypothetical protein